MQARFKKIINFVFIFASMCPLAHADSFSLPSNNNSLIGNNSYTTISVSADLARVAKHYDLGANALQLANPQIDIKRAILNNIDIIVPMSHLLPPTTRRGIVVNLPEMRLYYFLPEQNKVLTYPIGIGKIGTTIPIVNTKVTGKKENPTWTPPQSIRKFNLQRGIVLPDKVSPGPDNPLGRYAIYMRLPTYLIHSSIFPESIGTRASFGCIRMYDDDIASFFPDVKIDTIISILNYPVKAGWQNNDLYLEAHPPLDEHQNAYEANLPGIVHIIIKETANQPTLIDWQLVNYLSKERDGLPHQIGVKIKPD